MSSRILSYTRYSRLGVFSLALLVTGLGGWGFGTEIHGAVIAPAELRVSHDEQVVQHSDGGRIRQILVAEGDRVAAGDILLRLDDSEIRPERDALRGQMADLLARIARLEAQVLEADAPGFPDRIARLVPEEAAGITAREMAVFDAWKTTRQEEDLYLADQKAQIVNRISGYEAQAAALAEQERLVSEELARKLSLAEQGLVQSSPVTALQLDLSEIRAESGALAAQIAEAREQIAALGSSLTRTRAEARRNETDQIAQLRSRFSTLASQERALSARLDRLDLRAPISGRVFDLKAHAIGGVIRPADPVLQVVAESSDPVVIARIPPTHVDEIHPGQDVALRFSALNQRLTPTVPGRIARVSADSLETPDGLSYYRAEILPDPAGLQDIGQDRLRPGMPVEAHVRTAARPPISYLVKPMADYFARTFREE